MFQVSVRQLDFEDFNSPWEYGWISNNKTKDFSDLREINLILNSKENIHDKNQAWESLKLLLKVKDSNIRWEATEVLGNVFQFVPDKNQAWNELHRLTLDENNLVRWHAVNALGIAFSHIPDKNQAWNDLHRLTQDKGVFRKYIVIDDNNRFNKLIDPVVMPVQWTFSIPLFQYLLVRWRAADVLGDIFSHVPDKNQAWDDLIRLTKDKDSDVCASAYYSLGKASIFKATEAKSREGLKKEIENALKFFEIASQEAPFDNPSSFCLPFYKSFYALTFKKTKIEAEVNKYFFEAKKAVEDSENKEKLLEAVENLANALKEVQQFKEMDVFAMRLELDAYRRYCERATELLKSTETSAPGATKLIKKGLPIIDERIKEIITEIQLKTKALYRQTLGTPYEDLGKEVNRIGTNLLLIRDPIGLEKNINILHITLSAICARMSEEDRGDACELLKKINDERNIEDKLPLINTILGKIPYQIDKTMAKIEIKNVQIANGNGIIQKMESSDEIQNDKEQTQKKQNFIDLINPPATIAAFVGFISVEIGTYYYPISYNHIIGAVIALFVFIIVTIFNKS